MATTLTLTPTTAAQTWYFQGSHVPHTIESAAAGADVYYRIVPRNATLTAYTPTTTTATLAAQSDGIINAGDKIGFPSSVVAIELLKAVTDTATLVQYAGVSL